MRAHDKSCPLYIQAGRSSYNHFLSECKFLPEAGGKFIVSVLDDPEYPVAESYSAIDDPNPDYSDPIYPASARLVQVHQSPYIDTIYKHHHMHVVIDSGAT